MTDQGTSGNGRWRWLLAVLSVALVTAMVLMAACSGGDDDEEDDDGDSTPTATESTSDSDETTDAGDGGGDDAASDLSALAENYEDFTGVISYKTTGFADGSFTTLKIYKGENASRVDYVGSDATGTIITTADAFYICGEGACLKYAGGDSSLDPTAGLTAFLSADSIEDAYGDVPDGVEVEESSEQIAGVEATCYTYSGDLDETESGDENGSICVSESGLLLRLEFSGAGGGAFEATEATDDVSDADFEPPFPVTELPNIGQ